MMTRDFSKVEARQAAKAAAFSVSVVALAYAADASVGVNSPV